MTLSRGVLEWVFPSQVICCARSPYSTGRPLGAGLVKMSELNDLKRLPEWERETVVEEHGAKEAIYYAIGIGARRSRELHLIYENHPKFQVFPTFCARSSLSALDLENCPGIGYDLRRTLHGEQYIEFFKPIPKEGGIRTESQVVDLLQRGRHMAILCEATCYDNETNEKLAYLQFLIWQLNHYNSKGLIWSNDVIPTEKTPETEPDKILEEELDDNLPSIYRLASGDLNPLHIDPEFSQNLGLEEPIMHGFCTLGVAARMILNEYSEQDYSKMKSIKVKFSAPLLPGAHLAIKTWKGNAGRIHFEAVDLKTDSVVLSESYVDLKP
ncbi:unnamed protein product [Bursaphelenchus xylophilus]|uniref:(pine wood nematode) hypothetical protein n=1 Tax=Bursaphelenchus xylophilus TaxID=6326 RepID=A0A1I7S6C1_BURXY|nr:unnamed protein product [Bursaphelenchus xylophilus]CAG9128153.1 unnamed protein product [Bursaphelenchus xylophilus]